MLRRHSETRSGRGGRRWLPFFVLLGLLPFTLLIAILVPLALQARRLGGARTYRLSAGASYPPPGISGISGMRGGWNQQHLRVGEWVFEWKWLSQP
jgi:hypothetical protein